MLQILCQHKEHKLTEAMCCDLKQLAARVMDSHCIIGDINLVIANDAKLRNLNLNFRGQDRATDVLSFNYNNKVQEQARNHKEVEGVQGEIYISRNRVVEQAADMGVSEHDELCRLMVHALLHLAGFEHNTVEELNVMESETDRLIGEHKS